MYVYNNHRDKNGSKVNQIKLEIKITTIRIIAAAVISTAAIITSLAKISVAQVGRRNITSPPT
jgi:hypothetical protein